VYFRTRHFNNEEFTMNDRDLSPQQQQELERRSKVSAGLERLSVEDYTQDDLRALLAVSGLGPISPFARNQAYTHLQSRVKAI